MFDAQSYFEDRDIEVWCSGKNVTKGWINIQCPFCDDTHNHLGINKTRTAFSCWRCPEQGWIGKLVGELEQCDYEQSIQLLKDYSHDTENVSTVKYQIKHSFTGKVLPMSASKEFLPVHLNCLKQRRYDPKYLIKKYDLYACGMASHEVQYRIIIPVKLNNRIVSFVGMDATGKHKIKYMQSLIEESIIPSKNTLYNIDSVIDIMVIVEGIADVWRLGDGAIATFGVGYSQSQLDMIVSHPAKRIFVMFDGEKEAQKIAENLSKSVSVFNKYVEIIKLNQGDPDDLSEQDIYHLRSNLGMQLK